MLQSQSTRDYPIFLWQGAFWFLMGTGIFSLIFISGKLLGDQISIYQLMFFRYIAGFGIVCVIAKTQRISLISSKPLTHFMRAIFGTGGAISIIYASANMPVADATAISLLEGVMTVGLGLILFKDRLSFRQFLAIFLCVGGALLMIAEKGFSGGIGWSYWFPAFVALVSAVLFVLEGVLLKVIAMRENAITVMFYVNGFAILLTVIPALIYWQTVDLKVIMACFGLGVSAILAQYCNILGYRVAPIYLAGAINYTWIIFATFWGIMLFDEYLSFLGLLGAIAIIFGGVGIVKKPKKKRDCSLK